MPSPSWSKPLALAPALALALALALACVKVVPAPGAAADAGPSGAGAAGSDAAADSPQDSASPTGKPCTDDALCDDGVACTLDRCDPTTHRCSSTPDDLACQNGRYCDGVERCDPKTGCGPGTPVTCSDSDSCTIDRCVEQTKLCEHAARDADGDGDPDWHCGGGDCDDADAHVRSGAPEVCGNGEDDDCDGSIDEAECVSAQHDTCADPLVLEDGKAATMPMAGTKLDYGASCVPTGASGLRDAVGAIHVPAGTEADLDVTARVESGRLYLASAGDCTSPASELGCALGLPAADGSTFAHMVVRGIAPGDYPVYVFADTAEQVTVRAALVPPTPKAWNETCGTALALTAGEPVTTPIVDATRDLATACSASLGELVWTFATSQPQDVRVLASSLDGVGNPVLGLRAGGCVDLATELTCKSGVAPVLFARDVPAGAYFVSVSATAATSVQFRVELSPPTKAPDDETCKGAPALVPGKTVDVPLAGHTDDVKGTCLAGAVDAVRLLELTSSSDVLLVERISMYDYGAVSLMRPACGAGDLVGCAVTSPSPVRLSAHALAAGTYAAVVETRDANPAALTAFVRPASPPVLVLFADTCEDAVSIPAEGGLLRGNTSNVGADFGAGCDQAGGPPTGGPDQMLRLELPAKKRVVFDMRGSAYRTLLDVRRGPSCPGTEMVGACTVGYYDQRSFLDLVLEPGTYWVQVDGFYGESGAWTLDVFTADPSS